MSPRPGKRRRGLTGIDRDLLATAGAQLPQIGNGNADRRDGGSAGLANEERRRQYRVSTGGYLDAGGALLGPTGDRQKRT